MRYLPRDHCRAERSLSTVVGRLNVRIVQKSQQVATIVVPAKFVLQPVAVRIRHRTVAEMIAQLLLQPFGLHFKVLSLSSVICPPQVHGFSQKRTQTLAEAASSPCLGLNHLADRAQYMRHTLLLLDPGQRLGVVAPSSISHHHPSIVRGDHLPHLFVPVTSTDLIHRSLFRLERHQKRTLASHTPARVVSVDERTGAHRCPQPAVGITHRTSSTAQRVLADRSLTHSHPGQRSENGRNLPYRNAHPIVEHVGRRHQPLPHSVGAGPVLVRRYVGMPPSHLLAARPATAYPHTIRRYLGTPNSRYVGYVGNTLSLIHKAASTSGASVPRHWRLYNRPGDFFGRWRLAVAEHPHTRLAARTLGLAAALALRERRSLPLSRSLGLGEFLMQLFVGCRQPRVLLLKPRHQRDKLSPFRGGQA